MSTVEEATEPLAESATARAVYGGAATAGRRKWYERTTLPFAGQPELDLGDTRRFGQNGVDTVPHDGH
jgi:hypothetical protein